MQSVVTTLLGNLADLPESERAALHLERVPMADQDRSRPLQRVVSDHGTELGLRLPRGTVLRDGDILHRVGDSAIVVSQLATDVLVIRPRDVRQMGIAAHGLGNRHLPAQFPEPDGAGAVMVVPNDHTVAAFLDDLAIPYSREERVLEHPFRHAEHSH